MGARRGLSQGKEADLVELYLGFVALLEYGHEPNRAMQDFKTTSPAYLSSVVDGNGAKQLNQLGMK
eukprot:3817267-Amphidinium_carterae.1